MHIFSYAFYKIKSLDTQHTTHSSLVAIICMFWFLMAARRVSILQCALPTHFKKQGTNSSLFRTAMYTFRCGTVTKLLMLSQHDAASDSIFTIAVSQNTSNSALRMQELCLLLWGQPISWKQNIKNVFGFRYL